MLVSRNFFENTGSVQGQDFEVGWVESSELEFAFSLHVKSGVFSKYSPEPPKLLSLMAIDVINTAMSSVLYIRTFVLDVTVSIKTAV